MLNIMFLFDKVCISVVTKFFQQNSMVTGEKHLIVFDVKETLFY